MEGKKGQSGPQATPMHSGTDWQQSSADRAEGELTQDEQDIRGVFLPA
jgi:hypothetical protein